MNNAYKDENDVSTLIASANTDGKTPVRLYADPVTHRLLVDSTGGGGSTIVYNDTVTGAINGTNRVFTVPNAINYPVTLFLANSSYQSGVDYTVTGANQITYTTAPDSSLSGQPHWLAHT